MGPDEDGPAGGATHRVLGGRYRLIEAIARGGMSVVWGAHDEVLRRPVAVKLLAPGHGDEGLLRAEAQAAALLNHPNVCAVYDYGVAGDESFVVMELLDGVCLADQLGGGPLPWRRAVKVCAYVAAALSAAHARGLVHRDIKPGNIMLTTTGLKVVDFGIAAFADSCPGEPLVGTFGYLAPERLAGEPGGPAADVYALGVMLFAALTGQRPVQWPSWPPADPEPLPPITGLPAEVVAVYEECVAAEPEQRPSAPELARRFAALAGVPMPSLGSDLHTTGAAQTGSPTGTWPAMQPLRGPRTRRRAPVLVLAGTVLALAAAIAAAVFWPETARHKDLAALAASCDVTYQIKDTWSGGATVWLSVTNTGPTALEAWTLEFDLKSGQHVRTGWNGTWRQHGTMVTVTPAPGGAAIAPGMSTGEIGTNLDGPDATSRPGRFALNGNPCRTVAVPLAGPAIASDAVAGRTIRSNR